MADLSRDKTTDGSPQPGKHHHLIFACLSTRAQLVFLISVNLGLLVFGFFPVVPLQWRALSRQSLPKNSKVGVKSGSGAVDPWTDGSEDLQNQYTAYKNLLQQLAQKIGDVEQEAEEHK